LEKSPRGGGIAEGASNWRVKDIPLQTGLNVLTATARNSSGSTASTSATVVFFPTDTIAPNLIFRGLESGLTIATSAGSVTLSGTASDNIAVAAVTWSNDRGGLGTATGTSIWSIPGIPVLSGINKITVTAADTTGNRFQQIVTVTSTHADSLLPSIHITAPTAGLSYTTKERLLPVSGQSSGR